MFLLSDIAFQVRDRGGRTALLALNRDNNGTSRRGRGSAYLRVSKVLVYEEGMSRSRLIPTLP